jgi:hypothetical protein
LIVVQKGSSSKVGEHSLREIVIAIAKGRGGMDATLEMLASQSVDDDPAKSKSVKIFSTWISQYCDFREMHRSENQTAVPRARTINEAALQEECSDEDAAALDDPHALRGDSSAPTAGSGARCIRSASIGEAPGNPSMPMFALGLGEVAGDQRRRLSSINSEGDRGERQLDSCQGEMILATDVNPEWVEPHATAIEFIGVSHHQHFSSIASGGRRRSELELARDRIIAAISKTAAHWSTKGWKKISNKINPCISLNDGIDLPLQNTFANGICSLSSSIHSFPTAFSLTNMFGPFICEVA